MSLSTIHPEVRAIPATPSPSPSLGHGLVSHHILRATAAVHCAVWLRLRRSRDDDRGQATAEYALVLLGAAAVALMLIAWAGRTDKIGKLLDGVIDSIIDRLT